MPLPFRVLHEGSYLSDQIRAAWTSGVTEMGGHFDLDTGKECRLVDWRSVNTTLFLDFAPARTQEVVPAFTGNRRVPTYVALTDGTGVCSVVQTSDELLIVQRRRISHVRYPDWYHVCGGMLEVEVVNEQISVDPFRWMQVELHEELEVDLAFIEGMQCMGLVRDDSNERPELVFSTQLSASARDFAQADGPEHSDLVLVRNDARQLRRFLVAYRDRIVPSGLACLLLHGKSTFSESWYEDIVSQLG